MARFRCGGCGFRDAPQQNPRACAMSLFPTPLPRSLLSVLLPVHLLTCALMRAYLSFRACIKLPRYA
jgi:hypothetical protein